MPTREKFGGCTHNECEVPTINFSYVISKQHKHHKDSYSLVTVTTGLLKRNSNMTLSCFPLNLMEMSPFANK